MLVQPNVYVHVVPRRMCHVAVVLSTALEFTP